MRPALWETRSFTNPCSWPGCQPLLVRLDFSEGRQSHSIAVCSLGRAVVVVSAVRWKVVLVRLASLASAGRLHRVNWTTKEADLRPTQQKGKQRTDGEDSLCTGAHGGIAWRRARTRTTNCLRFSFQERDGRADGSSLWGLLWTPGSFDSRPTRYSLLAGNH